MPLRPSARDSRASRQGRRGRSPREARRASFIMVARRCRDTGCGHCGCAPAGPERCRRWRCPPACRSGRSVAFGNRPERDLVPERNRLGGDQYRAARRPGRFAAVDVADRDSDIVRGREHDHVGDGRRRGRAGRFDRGHDPRARFRCHSDTVMQERVHDFAKGGVKCAKQAWPSAPVRALAADRPSGKSHAGHWFFEIFKRVRSSAFCRRNS